MKSTETVVVVIRCPNCGAIEKAIPKPGVPWWTYIHECTQCEYIIMESEWCELEKQNG